MSEIELHRKLLADAPRNAAFHAALKAAIRPGESTLLDIGAGTGFLSFLARQLGARHCTLVEYAETLRLAQQLARCNGVDELTFVQGHSSELKRLPKVDVVVSETLGNFALEEGLLETLADARRFLKPGGHLIPGRLRQYVAPVRTARLQQELDIWGDVGFDLDLAPAREVSLNNLYVKTIAVEDLGGMQQAQCWDDLDFSPGTSAPPSLRRQSLSWTSGHAQTVHGLALWWVCELMPGIALSTAPDAPPTHWEQIYLPLLTPLALASGDTLALELVCDTRPQVGLRLQWRVRQLRSGKKIAEQALDSFKGRLEA